jgi:hypothetical protein
VTGDTTYGTTENIVVLEDAGIRAFFPLPDFDQRTPFFGKAQFTYDAADDLYRCPQGQFLPRRKTKYTEEEVVYRADAGLCNACPVKTQCTTSNHGRIVHRSFYADYLEKVRGYHATEVYRKACANGRCGSSRCSLRPRTGTGCAASGSGGWRTSTSRVCWEPPVRISSASWR